MSETGVLVGKDFSPKQLKAIALFATGEYNCTVVAAMVKVSAVTISKWRRNTQFMDAIYTEAKRGLKNILPELYRVAVQEAMAGKHQHLRIILDHVDNLEKQANASNLNGLTISWKSE